MAKTKLESKTEILIDDLDSEIITLEEDQDKLKEEKELVSQPKVTAVKAISEPKTTCGHERKGIKFDFSHIDEFLANMKTNQERIRWLKNYLKQLRQSQNTMYLSMQGISSSRAIEQQYNNLTPYVQIYPLIMRKIKAKLNRLRANTWKKQ